MMRPDRRIVAELADLVDFVFGFDVAVLGDAQVDADTVFLDVFPVETGIVDRFVGTVDGDRTGTSSAADFLAFLIAEVVKTAYTGKYGTHIAGFVVDNTGSPLQQILTKLSQVIAVRRRESDTSDDNAIVERQRFGSSKMVNRSGVTGNK